MDKVKEYLQKQIDTSHRSYVEFQKKNMQSMCDSYMEDLKNLYTLLVMVEEKE